MDPYRLSDDDKIIIDSRLSTLEKEVEGARLWRRVMYTFTAGLIAAAVLCFATYKINVASSAYGPCVEELKFSGVYSPEASNVSFKCDHPRHKVVARYDTYHVAVECVCR